MQYTQEQIIAIASLPETAFKFKANLSQLVEFYKWVKENWTSKAIATLAKENNLNCRLKEDKAKLAWLAAKELSLALPPAKTLPPAVEFCRSEETKTVKVLCQAIALLPPVPQTNGLENAPAYKILGSPIYYDELVRNYKKLVQQWHPDFNPSVEAVGRFQLVNEIYSCLREGWWAKYSPLIPISRLGQENIDRAFSKQFPWSGESFWG